MNARALAIPTIALGLAGCVGDNPYDYAGYSMDKFFPFDGERTWELVNGDQQLNYKLVGTLATEFEDRDGVRVHRIDYERVCTGGDGCVDEWDHAIEISSDGGEGVLIHGYEGAEIEAFDPPIVVAERQMEVSDFVDTETGGMTWTSTFQAIEACDIQWTDQWDECVKMSVESSGAHPLAGTYWAVAGWNIVAWDRGDGRWELIYATFADE